MNNEAPELIKRAVIDGYINGVHRYQDKNKALEGFHEDFEMLVLNGNSIDKINLDQWFTRIETMKQANPAQWQAPTEYQYCLLDSTQNTASVKIDVFKGDVHFSTDYLLLYKVGTDWKIVSKIFAVPQS